MTMGRLGVVTPSSHLGVFWLSVNEGLSYCIDDKHLQ